MSLRKQTLSQFIANLDEEHDFREDVVQKLRPLGVKVVYEPSVVEHGTGRVLFSTQRFNADFRSPITRECGGLIYDYATWKCLARPPLPFNPRCRLTMLNVENFHITRASEGTTVTLYYLRSENDSEEGHWCMSSTNGYDVSNFVWSGEKTYLQLFNEVMEEYPEFQWDSLNKDMSYTIGFHHPDFHPFHGPAEAERHAWVLGCFDTTSETYTNSCDIGLPIQADDTIEVERVQELIEMSRDSLTKFISDKEVLYGFVLRHKTDPNGAFSNIMIESRLLQQIRSLVYNDKQGRLNPRDESYIGATERLRYISLKSYLNQDNRETFIMLFPQFEDSYTQYQEFIQQLAQRMILESSSSTECLENDLRTALQNKHNITFNADTDSGIVTDLITSVEWLDQYYKYIYPSEE